MYNIWISSENKSDNKRNAKRVLEKSLANEYNGSIKWAEARINYSKCNVSEQEIKLQMDERHQFIILMNWYEWDAIERSERVWRSSTTLDRNQLSNSLKVKRWCEYLVCEKKSKPNKRKNICRNSFEKIDKLIPNTYGIQMSHNATY